MVFSSLFFLFTFLPLVLLIYFVSPRIIRNLILFIVSLIFYAWGEPVYVVLMLFSTIVDYTHGLLVERFQKKNKHRAAKAVLISSIVINLFLLCLFKYSDFFIQNINQLFSAQIPLLHLPLPIGISFYTFQTMSYTIDIYRGEAKAQKSIISFGAYVALFPQLIAGPIVQYKTISEELVHRKENLSDFSAGISRFLFGLGKKVLLANNIGLLWDQIKNLELETLPVVTAWIGIIAFAFQIYFDFSGYSDMAIGLGRIFGFHFLENFNYPYLSKSITEFWRRWHISLSSWFRDYVYIPLGGNRKGLGKQIRNICIVWFLTGFWHGASWNFLLWGGYFGLLLILEKFVLLRFLNKAPSWVGHLYAMVLVIIGWVFFAFDDLSQGLLYLKAMFGFSGGGFINDLSIYLLYTNLLLLIILFIGSLDWGKKIAQNLMNAWKEKPVLTQILQSGVFLLILFFSVSYLVDASYNPFLYFRF